MGWKDIPGWFGFADTYDTFAEEACDGDTLVEVGVAFGRSVAYLASQLIARKKRVTVYAVDPWIDDRWEFPVDYPLEAPRPGWGGEYAEQMRALGGPFSAFLHNMRTHAADELEYIKVLRCRSHEAHRMIGPCRGVLIDGNHDYEAVAQDIAIWRPHIIPGGILAGDDYSPEFPGVIRAVGEAFNVRATPPPEASRSPRHAYTGEYAWRGTTWWVRR